MVHSSNSPRVVQKIIYSSQMYQKLNSKCFICDENIMGASTSLKETETSTSREKVTQKLARLVGDDFCVVVSEEDVICRRCLTLFNTMDKYESDIKSVKSRLKGFISKKYGIEETFEPPVKVQRMNGQSAVHGMNKNYQWQNNLTEDHSPRVVSNNKRTAESQLKHLANTKQRGAVKLYKCIACDFKTTDLHAFEPHSSVCKGRANRETHLQQQKTVPLPNKQQVGRTTIVRSNLTQLSCQQCEFKTHDRNLFTEHQRNHIKMRPFKCRMCLERFATREAAQTHARIHSGSGMKCGICNRQFIKRETFDLHMKTHEKFTSVSQQGIVMNKCNDSSIQKPLTDIIKEALSEEDQDTIVEFHSCNLCSLTFVSKQLYVQHMQKHENSQSVINSNGNSDTFNLTNGDLESIFGNLHSENFSISNGNENIIITAQDSGGITYNITIPQDHIPSEQQNVRIDIPNINEGDSLHRNDATETTIQSAPISMPSLLGDENAMSSQEEQQPVDDQQREHAISMDLEELQQIAEQQLRFISDENGQYMQLDDHILTTDAEGNQILVQGTNQDELQNLLAAVGENGNQVLVQMHGEVAQGQMILVQNEKGESQLIDPSMLLQNENVEGIDTPTVQTNCESLASQPDIPNNLTENLDNGCDMKQDENNDISNI